MRNLVQTIDLSDAEVNRRRRDMSHWNVVAKALYSTEDETEIIKMLIVEIKGNRRPYIIRRIYSHFNAVRRSKELDFIKDLTKNTKRVRNETSDNGGVRKGNGEDPDS